MVEVDTPRSDQVAGMAQAIEQMLFKTFISHSSVEAFDKAVLHRLTRSDVVQIDHPVFLPLQDRIVGSFGYIVADHQAGLSTDLSDPVQFARNTVTKQRRIDHSGQTSEAEVINHVQNAEPAAA